MGFKHTQRHSTLFLLNHLIRSFSFIRVAVIMVFILSKRASAKTSRFHNLLFQSLKYLVCKLSLEITANFPKQMKLLRTGNTLQCQSALPPYITVQVKMKLNCEFNLSMKDNMQLNNLKSSASELLVVSAHNVFFFLFAHTLSFEVICSEGCHISYLICL